MAWRYDTQTDGQDEYTLRAGRFDLIHLGLRGDVHTARARFEEKDMVVQYHALSAEGGTSKNLGCMVPSSKVFQAWLEGSSDEAADHMPSESLPRC